MADASIVEDIDEGEYYSNVSDISPDIVDETGHESDEEIDFSPAGPTGRPSHLSTAKITEIINDCIEGYATAWKPGKGETKRERDEGESEIPVVYDNIALWEEAHAAGQREQFLEKYRLEAEYYQQRLQILCDEISKDPGDTVASVKMVSVNPGNESHDPDPITTRNAETSRLPWSYSSVRIGLYLYTNCLQLLTATMTTTTRSRRKKK